VSKRGEKGKTVRGKNLGKKGGPVFNQHWGEKDQWPHSKNEIFWACREQREAERTRMREKKKTKRGIRTSKSGRKHSPVFPEKRALRSTGGMRKKKIKRPGTTKLEKGGGNCSFYFLNLKKIEVGTIRAPPGIKNLGERFLYEKNEEDNSLDPSNFPNHARGGSIEGRSVYCRYNTKTEGGRIKKRKKRGPFPP